MQTINNSQFTRVTIWTSKRRITSPKQLFCQPHGCNKQTSLIMQKMSQTGDDLIFVTRLGAPLVGGTWTSHDMLYTTYTRDYQFSREKFDERTKHELQLEFKN